MKYTELPTLLLNIPVYFPPELLHQSTNTLNLRIIVYIYAGRPANIWRSHYGYMYLRIIPLLSRGCASTPVPCDY